MYSKFMNIMTLAGAHQVWSGRITSILLFFHAVIISEVLLNGHLWLCKKMPDLNCPLLFMTKLIQGIANKVF